jgi:hypothetical protein
MALLWCDGFDHYGGDVNNILDGAWAEVGSGYSLSSSVSRTGSYSLKRNDSLLESTARRVLGGAKTTAGVGFAVYLNELPVVNDSSVLLEFRDASNKVNISLICQSTGVLDVFRGDCVSGTLLVSTSTPAIVVESFQHIEVQATFSATVGAVEVRVNGVVVASVTGANTVASGSELLGFSTDASAETSQITLSGRNDHAGAENLGSLEVYFDDVYAYDTTGSFNNSWLGDRRVYTLFPDQDTAQADWTPLSGTGFSNINDPVDDDTSYISTGIPGSPSETRSDFELDDLPETTGLVSAVMLVSRAKKLEAGAADLRVGIISNSTEVEGATHPLNPTYTQHHDVFEYDPDTGAAFTTTAIDALQISVRRVT